MGKAHSSGRHQGGLKADAATSVGPARIGTVYDNQTRSLLETDQKLAGIDSILPSIKKNADGSVTVWFAPKAPAGEEGNWIQTMPGKGWNVLLRLYGPLEPWFDESWKPGDIELIE
jgi:hypothetical protein